ncbi:hypothetical protein L841_1384 [Mycobacterium sp. MAC_080597_8934]|nr:hypothetical protein L841_1384 [Mycobacterium sp. MAC_080597_8934]
MQQTLCRKLDGGMPVDAVVDLMRNTAFNVDPPERQYPPERITRTLTRFITAAVEVYCPYNQQKIDSITAMASSAPGSNEPTHRVAASTHDTVNSASGPREPRFYMIDTPAARQEPMGTGVVRLTYVLDGATFVAGRYGNDRSDRGAPGTMLTSLTGAVPEGDSDLQNPPQIPPPPPPTAHNLIPPRPNAAPPPPKQPPPPQEPPPPPQQAEPPAAAPQPGAMPATAVEAPAGWQWWQRRWRSGAVGAGAPHAAGLCQARTMRQQWPRHRRQSLPMVASLGVVMVSCFAFRRSSLRAVIDLA